MSLSCQWCQPTFFGNTKSSPTYSKSFTIVVVVIVVVVVVVVVVVAAVVVTFVGFYDSLDELVYICYHATPI